MRKNDASATLDHSHQLTLDTAQRHTIGYTRCTSDSEDIAPQTDALRAAGCTRIYTDRPPQRSTTHPELAAAIDHGHDIKTAHPDHEVILVVHELRRLGCGAADIIETIERLRTAGVGLHVMTGPLHGAHAAGTNDDAFFAVAAVLAEIDRNHAAAIAEQRHDAPRRNGMRRGRPKLITDTMAEAAAEMKHQGMAVPEIAQQLVIPDGNNKGKRPSPATVYRLIAARAQQESATDNAHPAPEPADPPTLEEVSAQADLSAKNDDRPYTGEGRFGGRSRHRYKLSYDLPDVVVCPTCGNSSDGNQSRAEVMKQDLQFVWLDYTTDPTSRHPAVTETAHCRQCQPHTTYPVECDHALCEAGPLLGGGLAQQIKDTQRLPTAVREWLTSHGWHVDSEHTRCPEHPIEYGNRH